MNERSVFCLKLQKDLPGLEKPPFPGELGQQIFAKISRQAWAMWKDDMQIKVLNEYRLNMGNQRDYDVLIEQMLLFLNLKSGDGAEVGNEERGKSK